MLTQPENEPGQPVTPRKQNKKIWETIGKVVISVFAFLYAGYCFWLGGEAASIAINSRNGFDNDDKTIKNFPGGFYKSTEYLAVFGILSGCVLTLLLLIVLVRKCKKLDIDPFFWWIVAIIICAAGTALFGVGLKVYLDYRDIGLDYIKFKYDPHDSRYSTFIPAQLSTVIINSPLAILATIVVAMIAWMKINEECCSA